MNAYHTETIEHAGLTFKVAHVYDEDMREPWREHDGHGIVIEGSRSSYTGRAEKRAGQVDISTGERFATVWLYDVPASIALAKRDGWGIDPERRAAWEARIGRTLTRGEVAAAAVKADMERMRGWLHDSWHWCGVVVTLLDVDGNETAESQSLWGIESDAGDYLEEVAADLAVEIAHRVGDAPELVTRQRIRAEVA